jgi:signal transduction histidine kinase
MAGLIGPEVFANRPVMIGTLGTTSEQMQTPVGRMSRTEIMANIAENVLMRKSLRQAPINLDLFILFLLMMGSVWILVTYPQSVALLFYVLIGVVWIAVNVWAFDVAHLWMPAWAPLIQLVATYMIFLSYQLSLNEQRAWRLQQEQLYLSEIEQLKTNFVSMMSHDLKTPIAKIQAICDRLLASISDDELALDLRSLRRSSDELHKYIQSILQVTKIEAKDFKINKEVTDLNENIEKVATRLQPLAKEKSIQIDLNLEPLFSIEADPTLIQEVVHNLVENAIKYSPPGGRILVTTEEKDDNVVVLVEDTGPGIPLEDQTDIWKKFTRGKNEKLDVKGTGLGLYLVKYFVELHKGKVFLLSAPGQGTRIGFSIPVAEDEGPSDS